MASVQNVAFHALCLHYTKLFTCFCLFLYIVKFSWYLLAKVNIVCAILVYFFHICCSGAGDLAALLLHIWKIYRQQEAGEMFLFSLNIDIEDTANLKTMNTTFVYILEYL